MLVEIGINTMKADYFKNNEEVDRIINICKSLDLDYSANFLNPCNKSEVRIVCSLNKANKFLKLIKQYNIHYDRFIQDVKNKNFIKKIKIWTFSDKEKIQDLKDFFDTRIGYTTYINDTPDGNDKKQFVVECYDNDFSIISEHFYLWDVDVYNYSKI